MQANKYGTHSEQIRHQVNWKKGSELEAGQKRCKDCKHFDNVGHKNRCHWMMAATQVTASCNRINAITENHMDEYRLRRGAA